MLNPTPPDETAQEPPLGKRLLWMGLFMLGGLLAVGSAAYILRGLLLL